jgi:hypothetical protein
VLPTPLLCRSDLPPPGLPLLGCIQSYPVNSSQLVFLGRASPKCSVGGRHLASCMQTAVVLDQIRQWHSSKQRKGGKQAASWARLGGHLGGEWLQGPLGMRRGFFSKVSRGGEKAARILTAVSIQARSYYRRVTILMNAAADSGTEQGNYLIRAETMAPVFSGRFSL